MLTFYNPLNLALGVLAGFGLTTYTTFKRKWWAGPFYNSWIVLVLFLMAYFAGKGSISVDFSNLIFITTSIVVFFGYANFVLTGYFKDIRADRTTAYYTLPVKFGRKTSAIISDVFGSLVAVSAIILITVLAIDSAPFQTVIKSLVFIYTGIGMLILTQICLHSVKSDAEAHIAISPCVHSYILLLLGLTAINKPDWFIPLLMFYFLYIVTLKLRPAKEQI